MKLKPQFLIGSEKTFLDFINNIKPEDKVGIISDAADIDGILSALLLEDILQNKKIKYVPPIFIDRTKEESLLAMQELKKEGVTKIILADLHINGFAPENFEALRNDFPGDVLLIDHHPTTPEIKNKENIIKNPSSFCSALVIYLLGKENNLLNYEKFKGLIHATAISEYSFKDPEVLKWLQEDYPDLTIKNRYDLPPGEFCKEVVSSIIYHRNNIKPVYELIKEQNWEEIKKLHAIVQTEIDNSFKDAKTNIENFPDKRLHFYYFNPKFRITSVVATKLSDENPDDSFILLSDLPNTNPPRVKFSARNQNVTKDMSQVLINAIKGLKDSSAGGHPVSSAGTMPKSEMEKFKQNLLRAL